ncbi:MAG TPA: hypothetical protein VH142_21985 [Polyangiaceae bacterium]|nr:hypothetical protein [Polyangiaceae bacterium]
MAAATLYRAMRKDGTGKPLCGAEGNMLGVRPGVDITADHRGIVKRGGGGLSVTPDDLTKLPPHVRPARLGGKGKLPVFGIPAAGLRGELAYRPDPARPDRHGFIEPAGDMMLSEYQSALAATQDAWGEVE